MASQRAYSRLPHASPPTRQRSFRLALPTLDLLEQRAGELHESANAVAQRLLDEALHTDRHPLVYFRRGGSGIPRPALVGTRLDVAQVIGTLRAEGADVKAAAEYLGIRESQVRACVAYYADFKDEVDAHIKAEREASEGERSRWEREQAALG
jgi:uncharacterized protein (DUF433 family)